MRKVIRAQREHSTFTTVVFAKETSCHDCRVRLCLVENKVTATLWSVTLLGVAFRTGQLVSGQRFQTNPCPPCSLDFRRFFGGQKPGLANSPSSAFRLNHLSRPS